MAADMVIINQSSEKINSFLICTAKRIDETAFAQNVKEQFMFTFAMRGKAMHAIP